MLLEDKMTKRHKFTIKERKTGDKLTGVRESKREKERFKNSLGLWNHLVLCSDYKLRNLTTDIYEIVSVKPCSLTSLYGVFRLVNGTYCQYLFSNQYI